MPSSFFGLNIAKSGMSTYNAWLNTTAHNVSNVKTPGYTRQKVVQQATIPISYKTSYGMVGTGSEAVRIESQRDVYYDDKYRMSTSNHIKYETFTYYMQSIESYVYAKDSTSGGMTNAMNDFFNSIKSLTRSVADTTIRTQTVGFADSLTKSIQEMAYGLQSMQEEVNSDIASTVNQINAYAKEIAALNKQINTLEVYGSKANDLRDKRAYIIDQLSELVDIDVTEKEPVGNKGYTQYIVSIGSTKLVDTYDAYSIICEAQDTFYKQSDVKGLYDLRWSNGQDFDIRSTNLGGKLQALFELRDGNNGEVFSGIPEAGAASADGRVYELKITDVNEIGNSIFKLDIPAADGVISIGASRYEYESFEAEWNDATQSYTYTFQLKQALGTIPVDPNTGRNAVAKVGEAVDFRGIPYYMSQVNEFIRTFSDRFNQVQTSGYDLNGDPGKQIFIGTDTSSGYAMNFQDPHASFISGLPMNATGGIAVTDGYVMTSYYRMTALNTNVDKKIAGDGRLLACGGYKKDDAVYGEDANGNALRNGVRYDVDASGYLTDMSGNRLREGGCFIREDRYLEDANGNRIMNGVENGDNLEIMSALENDKTMFKQGQPGSFLQVMTSTLGVDSQKVKVAAENAKNIRDAVDIRRLSEAGVDEDEEGQNLIICQNLLNYQYKVLSVMNEVLDKLINGTAV